MVQSKAYKDMDLLELKAERMRLQLILNSHPKPIEYKQSKKSLERINKLIVNKVVQTL